MVAKYENAVLRLAQNDQGRDCVVGDIHGHFELFEQLLEQIDFDDQLDRILSVGDSIDRGPDSELAMEYYEKPWFYSVIGNHEAMLVGSIKQISGLHELWMHNGGEWAELVSDKELREMAAFFDTLPYAIDVTTPNGQVGIVHADFPPKLSWTKFLVDLEAKKLSDRNMKILLWSRETFKKMHMSIEYPGAMQASNISGVHRIYVGHSIVKSPASFGNIMFIDTGAYVNGRLCAVDITNEEIIMVKGV